MDSRLMLIPVLAMVGLTIAVWMRMFFTRVGEMKRERISMQAVALSAQAAERFVDTRAADNFRNLFELPVLFYLAVVVAMLSGQVTSVTLALAWAFVVLRVLHSVIQCSYNKVMHRFRAYFASSVALWALWILLAIGLLRG